MAKKAVATLRQKGEQDFTKVVKMVRSTKTGAYTFKEAIVPSSEVKNFLDSK
ncbi:MAG: DUF4295 domain-containing protein [Bacteroidales bacterium]|nr:DUF4295 domain-containing protein [Bacteroidales bacterium]